MLPSFSSCQTIKCALTGLLHCSFNALITMLERQNLNQSVFWQINTLSLLIITKTFDLVRCLSHVLYFQLGKILATFHWAQTVQKNPCRLDLVWHHCDLRVQYNTALSCKCSFNYYATNFYIWTLFLTYRINDVTKVMFYVVYNAFNKDISIIIN